MTFLIFPILSCSTNPIVFLVLQGNQDTGMRAESSKKKSRETIWHLAKLAFDPVNGSEIEHRRLLYLYKPRIPHQPYKDNWQL